MRTVLGPSAESIDLDLEAESRTLPLNVADLFWFLASIVSDIIDLFNLSDGRVGGLTCTEGRSPLLST